MATVAAVILKHHQKEDGTWNVKIRIGHKMKEAYINTQHFVTKKQLDKTGKIKDQYLLDLVAPTLAKYRKIISELTFVNELTAQEIKDRLTLQPETRFIDFFQFCRSFIEQKNKSGKEASAKTFVTVLNNLSDFTGLRTFDITGISSRFLESFEAYLRSPRKIMRNGVPYDKAPLSDAGLHNQMRDLRLLFNAARDHYNDEDRGVILIKHYPFKKYKVGQPPQTESRKLTIDQLRDIRDSKQPAGSRGELARDLFMLSFYLCGMNASDMYDLKTGKVERVNYNRNKTKGRRKDKAFISIKLINEAKPLYDKYAGTLQFRYASSHGLDTAINKGLKQISDIDFYAARHSFGDLARNVCRFSKDDVGLALNHKDRSTSTTDIYISKSWDIVDEVQAAVVGLLDKQESGT